MPSQPHNQKRSAGGNKVTEVDRRDSKRDVAVSKADQKAAFAALATRHKAIAKEVAKIRDVYAKHEAALKDEEEKRKLKEKVAKAVAKVLKDAQDMVKAEQKSGSIVVDKSLDAQLAHFGAVSGGNVLVILTFLVTYFLQKKPRKP